MKTKNLENFTVTTHRPVTEVYTNSEFTKQTFYRDVKFLGIKLIKDEEGHSWISNEDVEKVLGLRNHIKETGKRAGFDPEKEEELVIEESNTEDIIDTIEETPETLEITMTQTESTVTESTELGRMAYAPTKESTELATTESKGIATTESGGITRNDSEIYVEPEKPTNNVNLQELMRNASKLRAREAAMPSLITRAIADKMSEEDLPEDLKEKVELAREAANPKFTPSEIADEILNQYRKGLIG